LVNNFVSGLILVFEHPVQVGDTIEVGALLGEVRQIGFRASIVRTVDGADVIIPNSELVGSRVVNWSLSRRQRRIQISVAIAFGTDPGRVIDILVDIARKHPEVLPVPAPEAVFDRFGDSALNFTLLCWTRLEDFFRVRSELTIAVNNAFKAAGIQIPFPQRDLHVYGPDGGGTGLAPAEQAKEGARAKGEPREERPPNPERYAKK
jgi:small-conductance mechanosensitive channel